MDDYLKQLTYIITNGAMDNTYKMSWIRSIVETCEKEPKKIFVLIVIVQIRMK